MPRSPRCSAARRAPYADTPPEPLPPCAPSSASPNTRSWDDPDRAAAARDLRRHRGTSPGLLARVGADHGWGTDPPAPPSPPGHRTRGWRGGRRGRRTAGHLAAPHETEVYDRADS